MKHLPCFKFMLLVACIFGWIIGVITPVYAESKVYAASDVSKEYQLKVAFLYNFAKFVEWPAQTDLDAAGFFVVGIFGEDPFGQDIDDLLASKTVNSKKIIVRRFYSIKELESCHILFVNSQQVKQLSEIMKKLEHNAILTVSENSSFTSNGGMINFLMEEGQIRFDINKQATDKAGLRISSQLLKLAKSVIV